MVKAGMAFTLYNKPDPQGVSTFYFRNTLILNGKDNLVLRCGLKSRSSSRNPIVQVGRAVVDAPAMTDPFWANR